MADEIYANVYRSLCSKFNSSYKKSGVLKYLEENPEREGRAILFGFNFIFLGNNRILATL